MNVKDSLKVKGIAIQLLLFHHLFYSIQRIESNGVKFLLFSQEFVQTCAVGARVCVWIFAFITAYGITRKFSKRDSTNSIASFTFKSWISLMSSYWFVYVFVFLLSFFLFKNPFEVYNHNAIYLALDFLGLSDFFGAPMLSGAWWYMCFAQIMVLVLPALIIFCKKLGWMSYIIVFIALQYVTNGISSKGGGAYNIYLLTIVLGILCAQNDLFERMSKKVQKIPGKVLEVVLLATGIVLTIYGKIRFGQDDVWKITTIFSSIATLFICYSAFKYVKGKYVEKALIFLGQHSGNIFMFHTFLYTFYPNLVYYTKNVFISWLTLLVISLGVSIGLEFLKKILKFNDFVTKMGSRFPKILPQKGISI